METCVNRCEEESMKANLRSIAAKTLASRFSAGLALSALVLLSAWSPATAIITTRAVSGLITVHFDDPAPEGGVNGVFEGIDFGRGQWEFSGPYYVNPTNHIYFSGSVGTSRSFQFSPGPRVLNSVCVYAVRPGTLTLSDDVGQTFTQEVPTETRQRVFIGWTQPSTMVTVTFTEGWALGVDEITYSTAP
jgi:hypothetical protein